MLADNTWAENLSIKQEEELVCRKEKKSKIKHLLNFCYAKSKSKFYKKKWKKPCRHFLCKAFYPCLLLKLTTTTTTTTIDVVLLLVLSISKASCS